VIDICIKEGGYNVLALKYGFSGLFISSVQRHEIFEAINYLYAISTIGIVINNIRLLNVNTDMKARLLEQTIKSKTIRNEMTLWYAKENQLYELYDKVYTPMDITLIKSKNDVKDHVRLEIPPNFDENKITESIYLYYKYLFFDTNNMDNVAFDYYSCSKMSILQRTHQILIHELPEDSLSEITISRLLNLNRTTDTKYMAKFENMWMAQWFDRWNLPCDYEYENNDDEDTSINEKKINDEFYNKKVVLVIYHQDASQTKAVKEIISKIKRLKKEIKSEKRHKSRPSKSAKVNPSINEEVMNKEEPTKFSRSGSTNSLISNITFANSVSSRRSSVASTTSTSSILNPRLSCFLDQDQDRDSLFSAKTENNWANSKYLSIEFEEDNNQALFMNEHCGNQCEMSKLNVLGSSLLKGDELAEIYEEINEVKQYLCQKKSRSKYFKMDDQEFKFKYSATATPAKSNMNASASTTASVSEEDRPTTMDEGLPVILSPKEGELRDLYKQLYYMCVYAVKIPQTIMKEVQFVCARNEADSKNFFFTKESDSSILDQKLKKDLINDITKYIVGPEIKYEITNEILNSDNLIENIASLFDSDRGMMFESNTNFTNWLFDICMKRKALNKKLEGKNGSDTGSLNELTTTEVKNNTDTITTTAANDTTANANNNTSTNETTTNNNNDTTSDNNTANNFEGLFIPL